MGRSLVHYAMLLSFKKLTYPKTTLWDQFCKDEFIQPFVGFYSMSNLLVIQQLDTLYLGENHVRVVCERV